MLARISRGAKVPSNNDQDAVAGNEGHEVVAVVAKTFTALSPPTQEQSAELAQGLLVGAFPLEPPHFHRVNWKEGQSFSASDDPDRTQEPWNAPVFVLAKDPLAQRAKTMVEELQLPCTNGRKTSTFARIVHGVLDEQDCSALISAVNAKGFTPALLNMGGGRQCLRPDSRDGFRVIVDDTPLASWLLDVIRPYLPEQFGSRELVELNNRCRFLCYTPGQEFPEHHDACYTDPSGNSSQVTVQLYLHDVPKHHGGATTFLGRNWTLPCQPGLGSVLIFSQDLLHEGSMLKQGLKYTFRTEAMYRRVQCSSRPAR